MRQRDGLGRDELFRRSLDRLAVSQALAKLADLAIAQERPEPFGIGVVVRDTDAGGQPDGAIDDVEMLDAVAFELVEIDTVEKAQRQEILEGLAGGGSVWIARPR